METKTHWDDGQRRVEEQIPIVEARQGRGGRRVLTVLVAALVLAFIVWIPVEIWGGNQAREAAPRPSGQAETPNTAAKSAPSAPAKVEAQPN